ncbi:polyprenyl synthetase family protein [Bacillus sp. SD088]|uniref:polyprenyl synthetase family protein n=1 Tax=Bacillus sp. SD088 TaxID=2782012 RepID=UPI001A978521|nr:polyprenyl synthetase family protein [Bacillus sp. SD088]MBO0992065.1 polyprenyl synthetase family protein [Bacillus sp. SD088]
MNDHLRKDSDTGYLHAQQKAADYFNILNEQVSHYSYIPVLTEDFHLWKKDHLPRFSISPFFMGWKKNPERHDYHQYIGWMNRTGKLDDYLDRSISYIFMRDLGKALDSPNIQHRVQRSIKRLKRQLILPDITVQEEEIFSMAGLYRFAQKEGLESTLIWVMEKLKKVSSKIPAGMDATEAQRKLIKIITGVVMQVIEEMEDEVLLEERTERLEKAIRLGYSYGLTYPFIDDLLDAKILSPNEERQYSELIRTTLITGVVPDLGEWIGKNKELIEYIHSELREAFLYIRDHQEADTRDTFLGQSYVFFKAQEVDRTKDLSYGHYTNEELYIPVIVKAASSRLIVRSIIRAAEDEGIDSRTFYYGIYNQLADDFADMFEDMKQGGVTPYTYYLKYHDKRPDLVNPFEMYWAVISYLIHELYGSDQKTCEVILDRAINGLQRYKVRIGAEKYKEVMDIFAAGIPEFNELIQYMVKNAKDVDFFDKLLRDHMIADLQQEKREQEEFIATVKSVRHQMNDNLLITEDEQDSAIKESIVEACNYSLQGDGKRLRSIMTWVMAVNEYGLDQTAIMPLLKSLEYMHTASLIFDDLPSQDNASIRRGRQTVHEVYNHAIGELSGLFLTQKAVEEQTSLEGFDPQTVLRLIGYSAKMTTEMCKGQAMDLDTKGQELTLEELRTICFYKTGIAFEASLIMPAILAGKEEEGMAALKKFAYHAGLAFQIKDDLLDVEGDSAILGKPLLKDAENNRSTFVSVLGIDEAKKAMWDHYSFAIESLQKFPQQTTFLKHLMNYIVNREY